MENRPIRNSNYVLNALDQLFHETSSCTAIDEAGIICLKKATELTDSKSGFIAGTTSRGDIKFISIFDSCPDECNLDYFFNKNKEFAKGIYNKIYKSFQRKRASFFTDKTVSRVESKATEFIKSFFVIPLHYGGKIVGIIGLVNNNSGYCPSEFEAIQYLLHGIGQIIMNKQKEEALNSCQASRKLAEKQFEEYAERFELFVKNAPVGIFSMDFEGPKFTSVNDVMCKYLGYTREELLSISPYLLMDERSGYLFRDQIIKLFSGQEVNENAEYMVRGKNGTEYWVTLKSSFIFTNGNVTGVNVIADDLTERKKSELRINQQNLILYTINNIYNQAFKCATTEEFGKVCLHIIEDITGSRFCVISEVRPDGMMHDIAKSGHGGDHKIMSDSQGRVHPPATFKVRGLFGRVIISGHSLLTNDPLNHPDCDGFPEGHLKIDSFLGVPFVRKEKVIGMIAVSNRQGGYRPEDQEILEALAPTIIETILHKKSEEEISKKEKELRTLVDNSLDVILRFDKDMKCVFANKRASYIIGLDSNLITEKMNAHAGVSVENIAQWLKPIEMTFETREKSEIELSLDGHFGKKYYNAIIVPEFNSEGNVTTVLCIARNITDIIKSQELAKNQSEMLLQFEKEKNDALNKAIDMKDEFLSIVSHEFRTPLAVINSAIQMMELYERKKDFKKALSYVENIKRNVFRQLRLVNNLLDITRARGGHIRINKGNYDIVLLSRSITESIREFAEIKKINLHFNSSLDRHIISIDEEKFERILFNLLSNAIKFTPAGKSIYVKVYRQNDRVCIKVRDEGIGIPKDKHSVIFERFGQVDSSLSRRAEGTGIGLSLVNMLVKNMGGEIVLESHEGKGSSFTISLPDACEEGHGPESEENRNQLVYMRNIEFSDIY